MASEPATLLLRIHQAFAGMPCPGDEHIVRDNSEAHLESARIKARLRGRHWKDIPFEELERLRSALAFLSPEGYRFYLPAFMFFAVSDFVRADVLSEEAVQSLTLPDAADLERIRELAEKQPEMLQGFGPGEWEEALKAMGSDVQGGEAARAFLERVSGFNSMQARVIREFLEYMRDVHGEDFPLDQPQAALDRYWSAF